MFKILKVLLLLLVFSLIGISTKAQVEDKRSMLQGYWLATTIHDCCPFYMCFEDSLAVTMFDYVYCPYQLKGDTIVIKKTDAPRFFCKGDFVFTIHQISSDSLYLKAIDENTKAMTNRFFETDSNFLNLRRYKGAADNYEIERISYSNRRLTGVGVHYFDVEFNKNGEVKYRRVQSDLTKEGLMGVSREDYKGTISSQQFKAFCNIFNAMGKKSFKKMDTRGGSSYLACTTSSGKKIELEFNRTMEEPFLFGLLVEKIYSIPYAIKLEKTDWGNYDFEDHSRH